mgnify:CR=1 FL=1
MLSNESSTQLCLFNERVCYKCKKSFPLTYDYWYRHPKSGFRFECKRCCRNFNKWKKRNRLKYKKALSVYVGKNRERLRENSRRYVSRHKNTDRYKKMMRRIYEKRKMNPAYVISSRIKSQLHEQLRENKNRRKWQALVGYGPEELQKHLENLFTDGMTWQKFLDGKIHIDHIRPICSFSFHSTDDNDFKVCWSLENLQPLWKKDNLSKGGKIDWST